MPIDKIVAFIFLGVVILGLFALLIWSMSVTMEREKTKRDLEIKKLNLDIEFVQAQIKYYDWLNKKDIDL